MDDFMKDRYGVDELTTTLGIAGVVLTLIGTIATWQWLMWIGLIVVVVAILRALSKNEPARRNENESFKQLFNKTPFGSGTAGVRGTRPGNRPTTDSVRRQARTAQKMWKDRKVKAFLKCPTCGQQLAVPKGKGRLIVTCPKCKTRMETRS